MQTDIYIELQRKDGNAWVDIDIEEKTHELIKERNYVLFSVVGDVRNNHGPFDISQHDYIEPVNTRRGLPVDIISEVNQGHSTPRVYHRFGTHRYSWLTSDELFEYIETERTAKTCDGSVINVNDEILYFTTIVKKLSEQYGQIRFVFGFDN